MQVTSRRRPPRYELPIPEAGAVVVTRRPAHGSWETFVEGGQLDGWTLRAACWAQAMRCHHGAARHVREAAGMAGAFAG
jgi:hypothetical protein